MGPVFTTEHPSQLPGTCFRCLAGDSAPRDYFLDTGINMDFVGVIYLCSACMMDFVTASPDFYTKSQMDATVNAINELNRNSADRKKEADQVIRGLELLGFNVQDILALANEANANEELIRSYIEDVGSKEQLIGQLTYDNKSLSERVSQYAELERTLESIKELKEESLAKDQEILDLTVENNELRLYLPEDVEVKIEVKEESPPSLPASFLDLDYLSDILKEENKTSG